MTQPDPQELWKDLPDSRLQFRRKQTEVPGPFKKFYERVFCVNCGEPYGAAIKDTAHILYLCQPCADKWGNLPLPQIPDELVS
jgi:hypothetical protein